MPNRSLSKVVQSAIDFKFWVAQPPGTEDVRPGCCPWCGAASRPAGGRVVLQGHGRRSRQLRGPEQPGASPRVAEVLVRRFRCVSCGQCCTVGPAGLLARRLFSAGAIGYALGLWALSGLSASEVRRRVSPWAVLGAAVARTWRTLRRWTQAVRERRLFPAVRSLPEGFSPRRIAERTAATLAACSSGDAPDAARAFWGAARAA